MRRGNILWPKNELQLNKKLRDSFKKDKETGGRWAVGG